MFGTGIDQNGKSLSFNITDKSGNYSYSLQDKNIPDISNNLRIKLNNLSYYDQARAGWWTLPADHDQHRWFGTGDEGLYNVSAWTVWSTSTRYHGCVFRCLESNNLNGDEFSLMQSYVTCYMYERIS